MSPAASPDGKGAGRPLKRSLTLRGHRTSVSLETAFWEAFREIAAAEGKPINVLAAEIDTARGTESGLAGAIRVHVLEWYRARVGPPGGSVDGGSGGSEDPKGTAGR